MVNSFAYEVLADYLFVRVSLQCKQKLCYSPFISAQTIDFIYLIINKLICVANQYTLSIFREI